MKHTNLKINSGASTALRNLSVNLPILFTTVPPPSFLNDQRNPSYYTQDIVSYRNKENDKYTYPL